ncbi:MAG: type VI secretion system protein TssR domain-containing protein [Cellulophaga sp.]|uniref:type VI secretion system protein TssR domain-containing protein n=1 Tax=Cellulophaga sp. TaxID=1972202 RepID=UPI0032646D56
MKNNQPKNIVPFIIAFLSVLLFNTTNAQVFKYEKIERVSDHNFNYPDSDTENLKLKKDKSILVVYSDRSNNTSYTNSYGQFKKGSQSFLEPYFVISDKNNAYEVVLADSSLIGKPKSILSFLFNRKRHFTDTKGLSYIGWISKSNTLEHKNSFISTINNKPLKYKIGVSKTSGLYKLNKTFVGDSLVVYEDPFFNKPLDKKLLLNQTVYPYKYNQTGNAVLISNAPSINGVETNVMGWVSTDLISPIGQGHVYNLAGQKKSLHIKDSTNLTISQQHIYANYFYNKAPNKPSEFSNPTANVPFYIWDQNENKLINVKGNNVLISDANRLEKESKTVNFHFIFNEDEKESIKPLINSLQNIGLFFPQHEDLKFSFSAVSRSKNKSYVLPKTTSFASWITFIQNILEEKPLHKKAITKDYLTLNQAIETSLATSYNTTSFENNFFIIAGSSGNYNLDRQDYLIKKMALKSSKLLFIQLQNRSNESNQNNLLLAKEILSDVSKSYNSFIENYIIDNNLTISKNSLKNIASENSNIYVYDAPQNSLFNGGVIFPSINMHIEPKALSTAIDTVLINTINTNNKLITSLNNYKSKLGVLKSKPSKFLKTIFNSDSLQISLIDKNNPNDIFYKNTPLDKASVNSLQKGYHMSKTEVLDLIENYRALLPRFAESRLASFNSEISSYTNADDYIHTKETLTRREKRILKRTYRREIRGINKVFKRKVIYRNDKLSQLFFFKTGIKVDRTFGSYQTLKIKTKSATQKGFDKFFLKNRDKVDLLEKKFLDNDLIKVNKDTYFIPEYLLL